MSSHPCSRALYHTWSKSYKHKRYFLITHYKKSKAPHQKSSTTLAIEPNNILGSEPGDTPHSESVVTVVVVCTRVDVATVYVQVVCVGSTVGRTRPPVAVVSTVVEGAIVDVPGIQNSLPTHGVTKFFYATINLSLVWHLTYPHRLFCILGELLDPIDQKSPQVAGA